jgi:hypothetical protein
MEALSFLSSNKCGDFSAEWIWFTASTWVPFNHPVSGGAQTRYPSVAGKE